MSQRVDNRELSTYGWGPRFNSPATRLGYGREYVGDQLVSDVFAARLDQVSLEDELPAGVRQTSIVQPLLDPM